MAIHTTAPILPDKCLRLFTPPSVHTFLFTGGSSPSGMVGGVCSCSQLRSSHPSPHSHLFTPLCSHPSVHTCPVHGWGPTATLGRGRWWAVSAFVHGLAFHIPLFTHPCSHPSIHTLCSHLPCSQVGADRDARPWEMVGGVGSCSRPRFSHLLSSHPSLYTPLFTPLHSHPLFTPPLFTGGGRPRRSAVGNGGRRGLRRRGRRRGRGRWG
jgi:hypothetical protein